MYARWSVLLGEANPHLRVDEVDQLHPSPLRAGLESHHDAGSAGEGAQPHGDQETRRLDPDLAVSGRSRGGGRQDLTDAAEGGDQLVRRGVGLVFVGESLTGREVAHETTT